MGKRRTMRRWGSCPADTSAIDSCSLGSSLQRMWRKGKWASLSLRDRTILRWRMEVNDPMHSEEQSVEDGEDAILGMNDLPRE